MKTQININAIPAELKNIPHWLGWTFVPRPGKAKPAKVPYSPITGRWASTTNPKHWGTFEQALDACEFEGWSGVGFVFADDDPFTGIDLDGALIDGGATEAWAKEIITAFNSYTELTPSHTGYHILVKGTLPVAGTAKEWQHEDGHRQGIEAYSSAHFFTCTGLHAHGTSTTIEARQTELLAFYNREWPGLIARGGVSAVPAAKPLLKDQDVIDKAWCAKNAGRFFALYMDGDTRAYGGDHSRADAALIGLLAYYTRDAAQLDRLFRSSALMREKWNERRGATTYGQQTIAYVLRRQGA